MKLPLPVRGPFHLEATVRLLQRRPANPVDAWDGRRYRRVLRLGPRLAVCSVENLGTVDEPRLELRVDGAEEAGPAAVAARVLVRILGLESEPGFELAEAGSPRLRELGRALRGARPPRFPTLFESFCRIVPYQQVSLDSGTAVVGRFVARFGRRVGDLYAFPEPGEVAAAPAGAFAGIGLSRTKVATLQHVARLVQGGELGEEELERLPSPAAMKRLDALPGIGPWSAALVLLRGLRRLDVFPAGDVGVQRGLRALLGEEGLDVGELAARMGERRGELYYCALGGQLLARGLIQPAWRQGLGPEGGPEASAAPNRGQ